MRALLDECLPRRLKRELVGHEARTAPEMGWASKRNGDLLRLAFYAVVLVALAAETSRDVRDLRAANIELVRLRDADMARATAEERARLARPHTAAGRCR